MKFIVRRSRYLSCARPLVLPAVQASELEGLIRPHNIGGVVLLESMLHESAEFRSQRTSARVAPAISALADSYLESLVGLLPHTHWPARLTILQAQAVAKNNPLWDEVGLCENDDLAAETHPVGVQAAVMLQHLLDEECGGWANTFG